MAVMGAATVAVSHALKASDRCDYCNAPAVTEVLRDNWASTLLFCGNHARRYILTMEGDDVIVAGFDPRVQDFADI